MLKNKFLRNVIAIAVSLAGLTLFASCDKNDDNSKKNNNNNGNTTIVQDWNHLTPQQKQEVKEAAYDEYDQDPASFEMGVSLVYTMMGKNPPASLNPHNWSDNDWKNFLELSEEMAAQYSNMSEL